MKVEPSMAGGSTGVEVREDGATRVARIEFLVSTGNVEFLTPAGATTIPFNASTMVWWRLCHTGGTLYLETSADGFTWTIRRSEAVSTATFDNVDIQVSAGAYLSSGTAAFFSKLNLAPGGTRRRRPRGRRCAGCSTRTAT